MPVDLPVDAPALHVRYLRSVPELTAAVGTRISTRFPASFPSSGRSIRLTLVSQTVSEQHGRLQRAQIQVNGYGTSPEDSPGAHRVTALALRALLELPGTEDLLDDVIVTACRQIVGIVDDPDDATGTAGYRFTVITHFHRPRG